MMKLEKYSFGIGDRFGLQGKAQLQAIIKAKRIGINLMPVWNKSFREHQIVGTSPDDVRNEADDTVKALNWPESYYVDADHIGLQNVDAFLEASDFFTLDVADFTGRPASQKDIKGFVDKYSQYAGTLEIPGITTGYEVSRSLIEQTARKFLLAIKEAARIYRRIEHVKGEDNFITEVSMDETLEAQTPVELFFILAAISHENIPAQTIAPKFPGRFNKGVDYVGIPEQFKKEFRENLAVLSHAVREFDLPQNLKLSIHSGSDKFSIYKLIGRSLRKTGSGIHIKTAGTTWLEELIGLSESGDEGLAVAKEIYRLALDRKDELCRPYVAVLDIDSSRLPSSDEVDTWDGPTYGASLRHNPSCELYNPHFRQLLHVGFKIAAEMGDRYLKALRANEETVSRHVCENLFERHIKRLFL
ncbi:MAG: hypothetical protein JRK26_16130 [Deltaproteobacteria bacterium]|nr:hypothetical protein [Deltaproteobacteria bacterium]MBW1992841.1 hypothetical protein [Deltaproteobacteria bacterium]